jgi:transglutaminase-like putative cysteine protease
MKSNPNYAWDWPIAALTLVLVYTAAARLSVTNWTPDLWHVEEISVLGMILGLALGISKFQKVALRWLVTCYSLVIVPWVLTGLIDGEKTAIGQLASLGGRLVVSSATLLQREPVTDYLFFVTLMCLLFWFIGLFSGYYVMRHQNILAVILPSLLPLLVVQYYDSYAEGRFWVVGFFFLVAILLTGRLNLIKNRERWREKHVLVGTEPEFDISRGLFLAALLVVFIAWSAPTPATAIPAVARFWQEFTRPFETTNDRLDDLLASLQGGVRIVTDELYGNTMSLGQSAQLGDTEIFRVKPSEFTTVRLYWRARVYDTYENGRWSVSGSEIVPFSPETDDSLDAGITIDKRLEYTFNWQSSASSLLMTPGYPLWISRSGAFQANPSREDTYDLFSWSASTPVQNGDQYQVQAALLNPTVKQLRAAPGTYPVWIKDRYLALPDNLPGNIRRLAERLTREHDNNYDKAVAITNYLRAEMEYNLEVSPTPAGVDPVEWFLFTVKSGFCNYYASAEVLLLRAAGIPARMVVGYAPGDYKSGGYYQIKAKDAHAWPEIYFAGIGWVEFEPTASLDVIFRPSGEERSDLDDDSLLWRQERLDRQGLEDRLLPDDYERNASENLPTGVNVISPMLLRWLWVIIFTGLFSVLVIVARRMERRHAITQKIPRAVKNFYIRYHLNTPRWLENWVRWSEVTAVERAFHAINQSLGWLGRPQSPDATALERAALLKEFVPASAAAIDILVAAHEKTLYTPEPANPADAIRAAWEIRYQALRARARRSFTNGEQ